MKRVTKYRMMMLLTATIGLSSCIKDTYLGDNASDDTTIVLNLMMSSRHRHGLSKLQMKTQFMK